MYAPEGSPECAAGAVAHGDGVDGDVLDPFGAFCERLNFGLLFKWFLDLPIDAKAFDASTFSKNRRRLLDHEIADQFFALVVTQAKLRRYVSSDHFSVDGTLLEAWASHKSFQPKDGPPTSQPAGRNAEVSFHGQRRTNETHASTTDPEARMARKSNATAAKLSYAGHLLMEHRNALLVDIERAQPWTRASCHCERCSSCSRSTASSTTRMLRRRSQSRCFHSSDSRPPLIRPKNDAAYAPSKARWSQASARFPIG
jgi:hypothetical protein